MRVWSLCAFVSVLAGIAWLVYEPQIQQFWDGHYQSWRDAHLGERLAGTGPFLLASGLVALAAALLSRPFRRWSSDSPWPWVFLLVLSLSAGLYLSYSEWIAWEKPEWDGYHQSARLWRDFFLGRNEVGLDAIMVTARASHTGTSVIPPMLIGLAGASGLSINTSFFLVNALAWIVIGWSVYHFGQRYLSFTPQVSVFVLFLVFSNQAVARSMIFPQTDPIALAMIMIALCVNYRVLRWGGAWHVVLLTVNVLSFFTKLTALPVWGLPFLVYWFDKGGGIKARLRHCAPAFAHVLLAAGCSLVLLWLLGLGVSLEAEFESVRSVATPHGYHIDSNPLRFLLVLVESLQLAGLFIILRWRQRTLTAVDYVLLSFALVFALSLVALKAAFWIRYVLPMVPLVSLVGGPAIFPYLGRSVAGYFYAAALAIVNVLFLVYGLYY